MTNMRVCYIVKLTIGQSENAKIKVKNAKLWNPDIVGRRQAKKSACDNSGGRIRTDDPGLMNPML